MNRTGKIGRLLFAIPFGVFGLNHFLMKSFFTGMLTTFIPGGGFSIVFTGILLVVLSILIGINKFVKEAALVLAIMLGLFIVTIHIPHLIDPTSMNPDFLYREVDKVTNMNMFVWVNFFKDVSLLGASLILLGYYKNNENA